MDRLMDGIMRNVAMGCAIAGGWRLCGGFGGQVVQPENQLSTEFKVQTTRKWLPEIISRAVAHSLVNFRNCVSF